VFFFGLRSSVFLLTAVFNYSLINIHAPTNDSEGEAKDQFYKQLERAYAACPSHDVKLVMGDANAKVGWETVHQPTIGKHRTAWTNKLK
jgi:hypothetical protein